MVSTSRSRRNSVALEIQLIAGDPEQDRGMEYGTHRGHLDTAHELWTESDEPTWADAIMLSVLLALGQTTDADLRVCLLRLAAQATDWIYDIDNRQAGSHAA